MSEAPVVEWVRCYEKLINFLEVNDKARKFSFQGESLKRFVDLREQFRRSFIKYVVGRELRKARYWVKALKKEVDEVVNALGLEGVMFSKELKDFINDPPSHLRKKLFNYMYDLLRGKICLKDFERVGSAALRTSLKTNLRNLYQCWVFLSTLRSLSSFNAKIIYPEHGFLSLERSGKQRSGGIPPNCIVRLKGSKFLSFFLEAPRPIGWEDSTDLKRAWQLYVALRPDILVYGGKVFNIALLGKDPPIKRPDMIIECKELVDWYSRTREIRGPFAKPLTAEEWRSKWIEGLWDGLADVLGVKRTEASAGLKEKKALRLKDVQIVALYNSLYSPKCMVVVSRAKVPASIKSYLSDHGIEVLDEVGFRVERLSPLADLLLKIAKGNESQTFMEISGECVQCLKVILEELESAGISLSMDVVLESSLRYVLNRLDDYVAFLKKRRVHESAS